MVKSHRGVAQVARALALGAEAVGSNPHPDNLNQTGRGRSEGALLVFK